MTDDNGSAKAPAADTQAAPPSIPSQLPIVPIGDNVVFPFTVIPLSIRAPKAVAAAEYAMSRERMLAMVALRQEFEGEVTADRLYQVGTVSRILRLFKAPDGSLNLILQGAARVTVGAIHEENGVLLAEVQARPEVEVADSIAAEALMRNVVDQFRRLVQLTPYLSDELQTVATEIDNPLQLAYLAAALIRMDKDAKQEILELDKPEDKLRKVYSVLQRELEILELGNKIQTQAQTEISKSQREYFLRQQLKAIQRSSATPTTRPSRSRSCASASTRRTSRNELRDVVEKEVDRLDRIPPRAPASTRSARPTSTGCSTCRGASPAKTTRPDNAPRRSSTTTTTGCTTSRSASWSSSPCAS